MILNRNMVDMWGQTWFSGEFFPYPNELSILKPTVTMTFEQQSIRALPIVICDNPRSIGVY